MATRHQGVTSDFHCSILQKHDAVGLSNKLDSEKGKRIIVV